MRALEGYEAAGRVFADYLRPGDVVGMGPGDVAGRLLLELNQALRSRGLQIDTTGDGWIVVPLRNATTTPSP